MKDMYEQIVKFGAYIVDGLREYKRPVLIYLPPNAELRGGAWAVLDSLINPRYMESYSDPEARAGVLEPEGIVEIKYKEKDLVKTIHRLDATTIAVCHFDSYFFPGEDEVDFISFFIFQLKKQMDEALVAGDKLKASEIDEKIKERIEAMIHVYHTVAVHFADLHDTPERMLEKGCINDIVPWRQSRSWLYWRLRRLLLEDSFIKRIIQAQEGLSVGQAKQMLRRWLVEDKGTTEVCGKRQLLYTAIHV